MITRNTLRKVLTWILLFAFVLPVIPMAVSDTHAEEGTSTMYVKTSDGKALTVREKPSKKAASIGRVAYRDTVEVDWSYAGNDGWSRILVGAAGHPYGYVQTRYLSAEDPGPYKKSAKKATATPKSKSKATPKPTVDPKKQAAELKKQQADLDKELKSEKEIDPCYIVVRPSRSTGKVNFRVGPSTITSKITTYSSGKELIAIGETKSWWRAKDPQTSKVGYISKSLTTKTNKQMAVEEKKDGKEKLGKLNVNGEFELTCKIPENYRIQTVDMRGETIIATVISDDVNKPEMYLTIAFDELYAGVERMNDLTDEQLAILEDSFTSTDNEVEISYRQTGYGTKLLVARESGSGRDSVESISVYKGYLVEFSMEPNPNAASQTLTDDQIRMCVDFLTDVDFTPVNQ